MPELRRPAHRRICRVLRSLDARFLLEASCYFGGGTQLAMKLGEYRESRDIDFLCSSRAGFRMLRETVTEASLGALQRKPLRLARDIRADRDGLRTFVLAGSEPLKLEIIFEARIELSGALDRSLGVPVLDPACAAAEKFLANADRGLDESLKARDLVDLAYLAAFHPGPVLECGYRLAQSAYGQAVRRYLLLGLDKFATRGYGAACIKAHGLEDVATLRKGLLRLRRLAGRRP
jgi:hypothetical protein